MTKFKKLAIIAALASDLLTKTVIKKWNRTGARSLLATAALAVGLAPAASHAVVVYTNNFSTSAGPEWNNPSIATAPSGEKFLGRFLDVLETLTLSSLPAHTSATVSFRLYTIGSWDGNTTTFGGQVVGPDRFTFDNIGPGQSNALPLNTTFANVTGFTQEYPTNPSPPKAGAAATNILTYAIADGGSSGDAAYDFSFAFSHTNPTLIANWLAFINQAGAGLVDESWGLDNVVVSVAGGPTGVPEPSSVVLLSLGLAGLAASRRRRPRADAIG